MINENFASYHKRIIIRAGNDFHGRAHEFAELTESLHAKILTNFGRLLGESTPQNRENHQGIKM